MENEVVSVSNMSDYKKPFRELYSFMEKYLNAKADDEFISMVHDKAIFRTEFEIEMANAVINEIERRSARNM